MKNLNAARNRGQRMALASLILAVLAISAAWAFELVGGYEPCPLCLQQRWAYYGSIPALMLSLALHSGARNSNKQIGSAAVLLGLVAAAFLVNAGVGVYHSGIEWHWWPGPTACAASAKPLQVGAGGLLDSLKEVRVVRCDEAPWRLLGLSFAGWNVVVSLMVAATSIVATAGLAKSCGALPKQHS